MPRILLSQAVDEYLSWLELDRHAAEGTVAEYRRDLEAFTAFAGGDSGVPSIARLDRDVLRAYQRTSPVCGLGRRARSDPSPSPPAPADSSLCGAS